MKKMRNCEVMQVAAEIGTFTMLFGVVLLIWVVTG